MLDSIVPNTSWLFLSFSLTGGIGGGLLCIPYFTVLYSQMNGPMLPVAVGFAAAGGGVGTIVFNLILEPLHQTFGWRHARQILAAALLVILTLNTLVLRCCTRQKKESPDDSVEESASSSPTSFDTSGSQPSQLRLCKELVELLRPLATPSFLLLSVGLVLYMCGFTAPYTHVVYYAELQGYENAAMLVSVVGAGSTVGRILCSFDVLLADFLWKLECGNILVTGLPQDLTVNSLKWNIFAVKHCWQMILMSGFQNCKVSQAHKGSEWLELTYLICIVWITVCGKPHTGGWFHSRAFMVSHGLWHWVCITILSYHDLSIYHVLLKFVPPEQLAVLGMAGMALQCSFQSTFQDFRTPFFGDIWRYHTISQDILGPMGPMGPHPMQGGICAAVVSPRLLFLLVILIQGLSLAWLPSCSTETGLMAFSAARRWWRGLGWCGHGSKNHSKPHEIPYFQGMNVDLLPVPAFFWCWQGGRALTHPHVIAFTMFTASFRRHGKRVKSQVKRIGGLSRVCQGLAVMANCRVERPFWRSQGVIKWLPNTSNTTNNPVYGCLWYDSYPKPGEDMCHFELGAKRCLGLMDSWLTFSAGGLRWFFGSPRGVGVAGAVGTLWGGKGAPPLWVGRRGWEAVRS